MVENLNEAVERNRSSSTWSLLFLLVVACGGVGVVRGLFLRRYSQHKQESQGWLTHPVHTLSAMKPKNLF